jgi:hypothetical protein
MKTGIIGLPQVGKTSLFRILTKAKFDDHGYSNPKEVHVGVARVPDERGDVSCPRTSSPHADM